MALIVIYVRKGKDIIYSRLSILQVRFCIYILQMETSSIVHCYSRRRLPSSLWYNVDDLSKAIIRDVLSFPFIFHFDQEMSVNEIRQHRN